MGTTAPTIHSAEFKKHGPAPAEGRVESGLARIMPNGAVK